MKIGLPKIRFGRKLLFVSLGMLVVLGGSGAAAIYVGVIDPVSTKPEESAVGGTCTTVQTLVLKTPARRLWLRKFIRMEHADGPDRIKTALRVAGLLAKSNDVDLVHVSVLDTAGPTVRAQMRGRAIGAEALIALKPQYLPDMKEPFIVRYYEGMPAEDGLYYGERVSLDLPEIKSLMGAMKDVAEKEDCAELPKPEDKSAEGAHGKKNEHTVTSGEHEAPAGHEAKPAEHGEEASKEHGAPEGEDHKPEAAGHEPAAKPEPSFMDSVLGMVGLGGSEEKAEEAHDAKADPHAATDAANEGHGDQPADAKAPAGHDAEPAAEHEAAPAGHEPKPAGHEAKPAEHGEEASKDHAAPEGEDQKPEAAGHEPSVKPEPSLMDSMLGMVGLGGSEEKAEEAHDAKADPHAATDAEPASANEGHGDQPADAKAPTGHDAEPAAEHEAAPASHDAEAAKLGTEPAAHEAQPGGHDPEPADAHAKPADHPVTSEHQPAEEKEASATHDPAPAVHDPATAEHAAEPAHPVDDKAEPEHKQAGH